jgi:uncharacterized protein DUF3551
MSKLVTIKETLTRVATFCASVVVAALLISTAVEARPGSWCASYHEGGTACGFQSQQQCLEDVSGIGGLCRPNYYGD